MTVSSTNRAETPETTGGASSGCSLFEFWHLIKLGSPCSFHIHSRSQIMKADENHTHRQPSNGTKIKGPSTSKLVPPFSCKRPCGVFTGFLLAFMFNIATFNLIFFTGIKMCGRENEVINSHLTLENPLNHVQLKFRF